MTVLIEQHRKQSGKGTFIPKNPQMTTNVETNTQHSPSHVQGHKVHDHKPNNDPVTPEDKAQATIMQHIRGEATIEPPDIHSILAIHATPKNKGEQRSMPAISEKNPAPMQLNAFGYTYYQANVCHVGYHVSNQIAIHHAALIDW